MIIIPIAAETEITPIVAPVTRDGVIAFEVRFVLTMPAANDWLIMWGGRDIPPHLNAYGLAHREVAEALQSAKDRIVPDDLYKSQVQPLAGIEQVPELDDDPAA